MVSRWTISLIFYYLIFLLSIMQAIKLGAGRNLNYNSRDCAMCQTPLQYSSNTKDGFDRSREGLFDKQLGKEGKN